MVSIDSSCLSLQGWKAFIIIHHSDIWKHRNPAVEKSFLLSQLRDTRQYCERPNGSGQSAATKYILMHSSHEIRPIFCT